MAAGIQIGERVELRDVVPLLAGDAPAGLQLDVVARTADGHLNLQGGAWRICQLPESRVRVCRPAQQPQRKPAAKRPPKRKHQPAPGRLF